MIRVLFLCHGNKTMILIDEYDVPLENAYFRGFYDEMIDFIRSLFESALKTNPYLEKSVITGCLRISKENFYHGFMAGLLTNISGYRVRPNRESGNGRPDIVMQTPNIRKGCVILLELKLAENIADLEAACDRGLAQIEEQRYAEPFTEEGYPNVLKYAVSFYKKDCMVQKD